MIENKNILTDEDFFVESARSSTEFKLKAVSHELGRLFDRGNEPSRSAPLSFVSVEDSLELIVGKTHSRSNTGKAAKHLVTKGFITVEDSLSHGFVVVKELGGNVAGAGDKRLSKGTNSGLNVVDVASYVVGNMVCDRSYTLEELCVGGR